VQLPVLALDEPLVEVLPLLPDVVEVSSSKKSSPQALRESANAEISAIFITEDILDNLWRFFRAALSIVFLTFGSEYVSVVVFFVFIYLFLCVEIHFPCLALSINT
jgi:hypothetical protein